jgi:flagellar hook-length control protein FliK
MNSLCVWVGQDIHKTIYCVNEINIRSLIMMQNLTLPTSQTLALGAMDGFKNSVSVDKSNSTAPNASFEMMLSKQVKAHKDAVHHKPEQYKPAQRKAESGKQNDNDLIDTSASIAQMVGDAKALLATDDGRENLVLGKQVEEELSNGLLINEENPTLPSDVLALALTPSIAPVTNKTAVGSAKENQSLKLDTSATTNKDMVLANTSSDQVNNATQNNAGMSQLNLDAGGKDSQQDRLLWASVTPAKLSQDSELGNGNALLNLAKDTVTKTTDTSKLSDIVNNLAIPTNQQNHASQPSSVLPLHQLGSSNQINAYPGKTGWDQAISQKIVWMVGAAEQSATLTLNPPDLGPLQVVINVRNDMADTTFISSNAEVRQALQDGMSNLREKMSESGIQLGQASVSSEGRPQQEFQQTVLDQKSSEFNGTDSILPKETTIQKGSISRINNGLVDIFA